MTINKPFAPSCERNQEPILEVLKGLIHEDDKHLLEIGSGTGQHAVFMAPHFPNLQWHTSELLENYTGIKQWLQESQITNIAQPIEFELGQTAFPDIDIDVVFTANTLHIMSSKNVKILITQLGENLKHGAQIIIYGPFNYQGKYTCQSNADFDVWLKDQEQHRGIRNFEVIVEMMQSQNIELINDNAMPANNRLIHFKKI